MFGIDVHPVYQLLLNFLQVKRENYEVVIVKVSEGRRYIPKGLRAYVRRIKGANFRYIGYYHFLTSGKPEAQARNFIKRVESLGGPKGKILAVDFESNAIARRIPSNRDLRVFVATVKKRYPNKKVLLYSGQGFWTGGDASGDASDYNVDGLWSARYADLDKHDNPRAYWKRIKSWWLRVDDWGGNPPPKKVMAQFTSTGRVAGKYVDVNVVLDVDELDRIAG